MTSKIPTILALFWAGYVSSEEVVSWADEQILKGTEPFDRISELSMKGPKQYSDLSKNMVPIEIREFTFLEHFALRTKDLNINIDEQLEKFGEWLVFELPVDYDYDDPFEVPEANLIYQIDYYLNDCRDLNRAINYLREELAILIPKNRPIADAIWAEIGAR